MAASRAGKGREGVRSERGCHSEGRTPQLWRCWRKGAHGLVNPQQHAWSTTHPDWEQHGGHIRNVLQLALLWGRRHCRRAARRRRYRQAPLPARRRLHALKSLPSSAIRHATGPNGPPKRTACLAAAAQGGGAAGRAGLLHAWVLQVAGWGRHAPVEPGADEPRARCKVRLPEPPSWGHAAWITATDPENSASSGLEPPVSCCPRPAAGVRQMLCTSSAPAVTSQTCRPACHARAYNRMLQSGEGDLSRERHVNGRAEGPSGRGRRAAGAARAQGYSSALRQHEQTKKGTTGVPHASN